MASLIRRRRLAGLALALALALTILPRLVAPLVSNELASWLPGTTEVLADESADGSG